MSVFLSAVLYFIEIAALYGALRHWMARRLLATSTTFVIVALSLVPQNLVAFRHLRADGTSPLVIAGSFLFVAVVDYLECAVAAWAMEMLLRRILPNWMKPDPS